MHTHTHTHIHTHIYIYIIHRLPTAVSIYNDQSLYYGQYFGQDETLLYICIMPIVQSLLNHSQNITVPYVTVYTDFIIYIYIYSIEIILWVPKQ